LHDGDAHVARPRGTERVAGRHQATRFAGEAVGEPPGVAVGRLGPEVKAALWERRVEVDGLQDLCGALEAAVVALRLFVDVRVVAERGDGRLAGYIVMWFLVDEAEIANLAVSPDARGRRVGALLLDAAIADAERRGIGTFFLEVRDSNRAARALYESRGFEEIARRRRYYRAPVEDALVMRRRRVTAGPARSS